MKEIKDLQRKYTWVGNDLPTFPLPVKTQYGAQRAWHQIGLPDLSPTPQWTPQNATLCHSALLCCHHVFPSALLSSLILLFMSFPSFSEKFPTHPPSITKDSSVCPILLKYFIFLISPILILPSEC